MKGSRAIASLEQEGQNTPSFSHHAPGLSLSPLVCATAQQGRSAADNWDPARACHMYPSHQLLCSRWMVVGGSC